MKATGFLFLILLSIADIAQCQDYSFKESYAITSPVELSIVTSDGDINFENITGGVTGITSDGHINGEIVSIEYPTELKTSDGGIDLTIPEGAGFDLEMSGENLHADFKKFNGDVNENYISGQVNGGGELIKLATSDGRINLEFN